MHGMYTIQRRYSIVAALVLITLFVAGAGRIAAPPVGHAAVAAAKPMLAISPTSIEPGAKLNVRVYNFHPVEQVQLALSPTNAAGAAIGFRALLVIGSNGNGALGVALAIPVNTPGGTYYLRAYGLTSHDVAYARLTVTLPKAVVSVSPATIAPGDTVHVAGTGFYPNEVVTITINSASTSAAFPLGQARANAAGAFDAPALHVPYGLSPGKQLVMATGQSSNRQGSAAITVAVQPASITVSPATVKPGDVVTVSGAHFQPNEVIALDLVTLARTIALHPIRVDAAGAFAGYKVTIPNDLPEGTVTIAATGQSSHASATTQLKIGAIPAELSLSATSTTPGATLTLRGHGFIPGEAVSIGLSNSTLKLALGTTVANASGDIAVSNIQVPSFLTPGTYSITASGQSSGRTASADISVAVHRAAVPTLSVTGAAPISGAYQVSPGSLVQVAGSGFPAGASVALMLAGPHTISLLSAKATAQGIIAPLGVTIPATTPPGTYTLAAVVGGHTLADTHVRVVQLAPHVALSPSTLVPGHTVTVTGSGFAANEQIVLALNGVALLTKPVTVLTNAKGSFSATFTVPQTVTNGSNVLAASGASSRAVATVNATASLPVASTWYFANGDTTNGRTTSISILNPGDAVATVKMTFLYQGAPGQHYTQPVPAHTLAVVDLGLVAGSGRAIGTILQADRQVSAESTVNFPGGDNESAVGATGPATRWYLAEGYTNGGFSETLHIMNPNSTYATVDVQFLPFNNKPAREIRFVMLPDSVIQVDAGQYMPGLSISAIVSADKSIVVERSMHFGVGGRGFHDKIGSTSPSTVWLFAQGDAAADQQTFFTVLNPNQAAQAAVTATFFNSVGQPVGARTIVIDPLRRGNIKLNDVLPTAQVATVLTSNVPIVVERPLYQGPAHLAQASSGSVVFGRNGGGLTWAFPGGSTVNGDQTTMYLFNPGVQPVQVKATFYTDGGAVLSQTITLAPNSDITLNAASVPGMPAARFGAVLQSTNSQPFIAEESVQNAAAQTYSSTGGVAQ